MDFGACLELLATRPAHAHEHCDADKQEHAHAHAADVEGVAAAVNNSLYLDADVSASTPATAELDLPTHDTRSVSELGRAFFALQEQRVQIYAEFQEGFAKFKASAQFQPFCTRITAQFADMSRQVNAIEAALRARGRVSLAQLVRKVQGQEKDKLLLTSALLVEKMRLSDMERRDEPDASTTTLLEKSILQMTGQHTDIIVQINELLDELREELMDEDD